jgi:hypothetical protein
MTTRVATRSTGNVGWTVGSALAFGRTIGPARVGSGSYVASGRLVGGGWTAVVYDIRPAASSETPIAVRRAGRRRSLMRPPMLSTARL